MKKLGYVNICGIKYPVVEKSVEEEPQLGDCDGFICNGQITLDETNDGELFKITLIHEITHGIWDRGSILTLLSSALGLPRSHRTVVELEEAIIGIQTVHLLQALKSIKSLKL